MRVRHAGKRGGLRGCGEVGALATGACLGPARGPTRGRLVPAPLKSFYLAIATGARPIKWQAPRPVSV